MDKLKKIKDNWVVISFFISTVVAVFLGVHNLLNKNDEILSTIKTTQQMALKSVIWNDGIPLTERASACDIYLNAGYNSITKKKCEKLVNEGIDSDAF